MMEQKNIISSGVLLDGRYKLLRPLSSDGGTADVWLALDTNTIDEIYDDDNDSISSEEESGIKVAIKIYRPKNALDLGEQKFREEFKIVFNCHHTNLLQPINFSIFEGIPYLVLPYCGKGSSEALIRKMSTPDELWRYIADVSAGLAYLHDMDPPIVHNDIKPANVLLDNNGNYAITDFGISAHRGLSCEGYDEALSGTMAYMAPERFNYDYESTPESDIWSFGATLYELIEGKVPFGEEGGKSQMESGAQCPPITGVIPSDIKRLIYDCLSSDIAKRPSAALINKAAENRSYPVRNKTLIYMGAGVLATIILLVVLLVPGKNGASSQKESIIDNRGLSVDERFEQALRYINSSDREDVEHGMLMLDSLSALNYIPAIYQQAYTLGWFIDSASVARKDLLGIEYFPESSKTAYLPKSKQVSLDAISLFSKIERLANPDYPEINARSLYTLAIYTSNSNDLLKKDPVRTKELLRKAREWAEKSGNTDLIKRIQEYMDD